MRAFLTQVTAVIANGGTVSAAVSLGDRLPVALQMPGAFTGATVSFQGSFDGSTFQEIDVGGAAYSEIVTASKTVALDPGMFLGFRQIKVVSASAEGAARSVVVLLRTDA